MQKPPLYCLLLLLLLFPLAARTPGQTCPALTLVPDLALEDMHFGGSMYGRVLGPSARRGGGDAMEMSITVGGLRARIALVDRKLRISGSLLDKPRQLRKAADLVLGEGKQAVHLRLVPFLALPEGSRGAASGKDRRDDHRQVHWLVYRRDGLRGEVARTTFFLLDADLNGSFTDVGRDMILIGYSLVPLVLGGTVMIGSGLFAVEPAPGGKSLNFRPYLGATSRVKPFANINTPVPPDWLVVRRKDGLEFLLTPSAEQWALPVGTYELRHARLGRKFEVLSQLARPDGRGLDVPVPGFGAIGEELGKGIAKELGKALREKLGKEWGGELEKEIKRRRQSSEDKGKEAVVPAWGGPFRLHVMGRGLVDPELPEGRRSRSVAGKGSWLIFNVDRVLLRGARGEIYDRIRRGPAARVGGLYSFGGLDYTLYTVNGKGKKDKRYRWSFARKGRFTSHPGTGRDTRYLVVEAKLPGFGRFHQEVGLLK